MQGAETGSTNLPAVRRLEAVGFRAWPSKVVIYDGSWQLRLNPGHASKRLNCLVPLDPSDIRDIDGRLAAAAARFARSGMTLHVRETPLAPPVLIEHLGTHGWTRFETVHVMSLELESAVLPEALDHLPMQDPLRFVDACMKLSEGRAEDAGILLDIISGIRPPSGYFLIDDVKAGPRAALLCVQDNDLAGLQSLAVAEDVRRRGLGRELVVAALRWARLRGATSAWLQVSAGNAAAIALYRGLGFRTVYDYHYWQEDRT